MTDTLTWKQYLLAAMAGAASGLVWIGILALRGKYGLTMFVAMPLLMGFCAGTVAARYGVRRQGQIFKTTLATAGLSGLLLLAAAIEGLICIAMAAPLAIPLMHFGGWIAVVVSHGRAFRNMGHVAFVLWIALPPAVLAGETALGVEAPLRAVVTAIEVDAPPDAVWRHVVEFSELAPPAEWLFRTGIAYPVRATINGRGPGAVRRCEFTTGAFVEPITTWDEPRLLAFDVTENPAPMNEMNPFAEIHPPHLDGYFVSHRGQFRLEPLPGGRTRLEGTTWYTQRLWPVSYWSLWSDVVIHQIHGRVLRHVKVSAEAATPER